MSDFDYIIYTDGACSGNPGSGGWAAIILNKNSGHKSKKTGGEIETTNNRTDSKYVINGIQLWIKKWKTNDWIGSNKKKVKNKDLWMKLDILSSQFQITWNWVKGHSGNKYNEEVDRLARDQINLLH